MITFVYSAVLYLQSQLFPCYFIFIAASQLPWRYDLISSFSVKLLEKIILCFCHSYPYLSSFSPTSSCNTSLAKRSTRTLNHHLKQQLTFIFQQLWCHYTFSSKLFLFGVLGIVLLWVSSFYDLSLNYNPNLAAWLSVPEMSYLLSFFFFLSISFFGQLQDLKILL